jgi:hypothetical protein
MLELASTELDIEAVESAGVTESEAASEPVEVDDRDIVVTQSVDEAPRITLRLRYPGKNAFVGDYLTRFRRGEAVAVDAAEPPRQGEVVLIEVEVEGATRFVVRAEIMAVEGNSTRARLLGGPYLEGLVAALMERELGREHARRLLG